MAEPIEWKLILGLANAALARGVTPVQIANRLNMDVESLSSYMAGIESMPYDYITALEDLLDIEINVSIEMKTPESNKDKPTLDDGRSLDDLRRHLSMNEKVLEGQLANLIKMESKEQDLIESKYAIDKELRDLADMREQLEDAIKRQKAVNAGLIEKMNKLAIKHMEE